MLFFFDGDPLGEGEVGGEVDVVDFRVLVVKYDLSGERREREECFWWWWADGEDEEDYAPPPAKKRARRVSTRKTTRVKAVQADSDD